MTERKKLGLCAYRGQNRVDVRDKEITRDGEPDADQNPAKNGDGNDTKDLRTDAAFPS